MSPKSISSTPSAATAMTPRKEVLIDLSQDDDDDDEGSPVVVINPTPHARFAAAAAATATAAVVTSPDHSPLGPPAKKRRPAQLKSDEDYDDDESEPTVVLDYEEVRPMPDLDSSSSSKKRKAVLSAEEAGASSPSSVFDCQVCLESNVDGYLGYHLCSCHHVFCRQCLYEYIQCKLKERAVGHAIVCPQDKCRQKLQVADIRACTLEVGDRESWATYQELSTESYLDSAVTVGVEQRPSKTIRGRAAAAAVDAASSTSTTDSALRRCPTNHCNYIFAFEQYPTSKSTNKDRNGTATKATPIAQGQLFACPMCEHMYCLYCPVVMQGVRERRLLLDRHITTRVGSSSKK
jgi:IBR domain, a half RING-finger domain